MHAPPRRLIARTVGLRIALPLALLAGCESGTAPTQAAPAPESALTESARSANIVAIPFFVRTASGPVDPATITPATLLYEARAGMPLLAPDGHQVSWGEFSAIEGNVSVQCLQRGTKVTLHLSGLIPKGVYTIWNVTFKAPGFDGTLVDGMPNNVIGIGAAGPSDGSRNVFRASASGEGSISVISEGGPLSVIGDLGACALSDEFEWHVVGLYHIDGQAHGPSLGPDGTMAEQFAFIFRS